MNRLDLIYWIENNFDLIFLPLVSIYYLLNENVLFCIANREWFGIRQQLTEKKMNERKRNCSSYTQLKSHWNFKGNGWIEKYWRKKPLRYIASRLNHSFRNVNLWHCNYYFLAVYVFVVAMHSHNSFGYDRSRIQYSRRYTKTQKHKHPNKSWIAYPATKIISLVFQCKTLSMRKLQRN